MKNFVMMTHSLSLQTLFLPLFFLKMGLESDSGETAWCATCGLENTPIFSCATLSSTLMICARTDSGETA